MSSDDNVGGLGQDDEPDSEFTSIGPQGLDSRIQEALGKTLSSHYDDLLKAPIPDRFLMLLAELEAKERGHEK